VDATGYILDASKSLVIHVTCCRCGRSIFLRAGEHCEAHCTDDEGRLPIQIEFDNYEAS